MKNFFEGLLKKWTSVVKPSCKHEWEILSSKKYYGIFGNSRGHYKLKQLVLCTTCNKIKKITL